MMMVVMFWLLAALCFRTADERGEHLLMIFVFGSEGERDKFERVYNKYRGLMLHKAYGILRDRMLAEDAVSEAFIRIYRNLHKIDDAESNRTAAFVSIIARNAALSLLRTKKRTAEQALTDAYLDDADTEQAVLSALAAQDLYAALDALDEDFRSVFVLKYAYDLSHREIGKLLGISENNVTVRLHRVRKKLAALLPEGGDGLEA